MKLCALIPNEAESPSTWWRVTRPFELLQRRGHTTKIIPLLETIPTEDICDAIVIIHRIVPANPDMYIKDLYNRGAATVLYSIDDYTVNVDVFRQYLSECGGLTQHGLDKIMERVPRQIETMNLCDGVIVTTHNLRELIIDHVEVPVFVLANAIDERWFTDALDSNPPYQHNSDSIYIGYASGRRPERDLLPMARAWEHIGKTYENVRFVVAGWQPDVIDSRIDLDKKVRIPWRPLAEWPKSMQVDIGCCPVAPTLFNDGKSPIKYYEYTLAGAVVVGSPFYLTDIISGHNGYIAKTTNEWILKLETLINQPGQREALQRNAYYGIHNFLSLDATITDWELVLNGCLP
jgi:glycosyltransferase involved in cell wall biosynthesis